MKILLLLSIGSLLYATPPKKITVSTKNTLNQERYDALIRIPKDKIPRSLHLLNFIILDKETETPFQAEDVDGDGNWDNILLVSNYKAKETKLFVLKKTNIPKIYTKATDVYFGVGNTQKNVKEVQKYSRKKDKPNKKFFQMEGPAWENDKVGYRMYFDTRNCIDIFGKTTNKLMLSKVGIGVLKNYHQRKKWGMDVLKVKKSLGAGAIALKSKEKFLRIKGEHNTVFKTLEEGPIKASFIMEHKGVGFKGKQIEVQHKISIYKGQYYYVSDVMFSKKSNHVNLVAGIVNLKNNKVWTYESDQMFVLSSYGKQSENNDNLGMALLVDKKHKLGFGKINNTQDISNSHYLEMKIKRKFNRFYFVSGWELSDKNFSNQERFTLSLKTIANEIANPVLIL